MQRKCVPIALSIFVLSAAAEAQDRHLVKITIDHGGDCRELSVDNAPKRTSRCVSPLQDEKILLHPGESAEIWLRNSNPFYFSYKLDKGEAVDSPNTKALTEFVKAFAPVGKFLASETSKFASRM